MNNTSVNNLVKTAAISLVLATSQYAGASTVECSDAKGKTRYSEWQYDGGVAPAQGMAVTKSSIILQNKVIDQTTTREGIFSEPEAKFTYNYAERAELGVVEKEEKNLRIEFFGVLAVIEQLTDTGYEVTALKYVICKSKSDLYAAP